MRLAAKIDKNQTEIVAALRKAGASVQSLAAIGKGCPDLLVGYNGFTVLMEIKAPDAPFGRAALTKDQIKWHSEWRGSSLAIVNSVEGALELLRVCK